MNLAIITDSTCDLPRAELERLGVQRVPLYVNFEGRVRRDWVEITPAEIIAGVKGGADLPTTSQPSPQDFEEVFREALASGHDAVLCLTISAELSGTFQSATLAREAVGEQVTVFDSRAASIGLGNMVVKAAELRDSGADLPEILRQLKQIRDSSLPFFTVGGLEFLQKGGRIGRASALVGSLLNIKPILTVVDGRIEPLGRARGTKKALREIVGQVESYQQRKPGKLVMTFLHVQDPAAAQAVKDAVEAAGIEYRGGEIYEIGAVIASHVGPGTHGLYLYNEPS